MRKSFIAVMLLVLWSAVSCAPADYSVTLTANAADPTPTRETAPNTPFPTDAPAPTNTPNPSNMWNLDCLVEQEHRDTFQNPNPCLSGQVQENLYGASQVRPLQYSVAFESDLYGVKHGTDMWYEGGTRINVTFYAGGVGLATNWMTLDNSCYLLITHIDSTINLLEDANRANAATNFYIAVVLHTSNGEPLYLPGAPIATTWTETNGQVHYEFTADNRQFLFPFYFEDLQTEASIEVLFRSIYGIADHGSTVTFRDIILVKPSDAGNCRDVQGF